MLETLKPFWRERPLDTFEVSLFATCARAHAESALRDNLSSRAVCMSAVGSGDYTKALASALLTLGELHAPMAQAMAFLSLNDPAAQVPSIIGEGKRVPGWGTSFIKCAPDPAWSEVGRLLDEHTELGKTLQLVTDRLYECGKRIHPNPGGLTAAVALCLQMPPSVASYLFVAGRLEMWSSIFLQNSTAGNVWKP